MVGEKRIIRGEGEGKSGGCGGMRVVFFRGREGEEERVHFFLGCHSHVGKTFITTF